MDRGRQTQFVEYIPSSLLSEVVMNILFEIQDKVEEHAIPLFDTGGLTSEEICKFLTPYYHRFKHIHNSDFD